MVTGGAANLDADELRSANRRFSGEFSAYLSGKFGCKYRLSDVPCKSTAITCLDPCPQGKVP